VQKRSLPLLAVAVLAVAGCGSSSKPNTTSNAAKPAPLTKATFVASLNSLCTRADSAFAAAHSLKGETAVVSHYLVLFKSLKPPPQLASLYSRYTAVIAHELTDIQKDNLNGLYALAHSQAKPLVKQIGAIHCITGS
jgi:hypothetical protein